MFRLAVVYFSLALLWLGGIARAAVTQDFVVDLQATVSGAAPHIRLAWTQRQQAIVTSQKMHRRLKGGAVWILQAPLTNTQTSFADPTALPGVEYEYWMERRFSSVFPDVAIGYRCVAD